MHEKSIARPIFTLCAAQYRQCMLPHLMLASRSSTQHMLFLFRSITDSLQKLHELCSRIGSCTRKLQGWLSWALASGDFQILPLQASGISLWVGCQSLLVVFHSEASGCAERFTGRRWGHRIVVSLSGWPPLQGQTTILQKVNLNQDMYQHHCLGQGEVYCREIMTE